MDAIAQMIGTKLVELRRAKLPGLPPPVANHVDNVIVGLVAVGGFYADRAVTALVTKAAK